MVNGMSSLSSGSGGRGPESATGDVRTYLRAFKYIPKSLGEGLLNVGNNRAKFASIREISVPLCLRIEAEKTDQIRGIFQIVAAN